VVVDSRGSRSITDENLPLNIGSQATADIRIPGAESGGTAASIDLLEDRPFLHKISGDVEISVNEEAVTANRWLADGDEIVAAGVRIHCQLGDGEMRFAVTEALLEYETHPPDLAVSGTPDIDAHPEPIVPVQMRAQPLVREVETTAGTRLKWTIYGALAVLFLVAAYLFNARAVLLDVSPGFADVNIAGAVIAPKFAGRYLLLQGEYRVVLSAPGYHPVREEIEVDDTANQVFPIVMRKLPGRLAIRTVPATDARVLVDDAEAGQLPGPVISVEPGERVIRVIAERYLEFTSTVVVEGRDVLQEVQAQMQPGWGDIEFVSEPSDAEIYVDDEPVGRTPATLAVMAGDRVLLVRKEGFKSWKNQIRVDAGQGQALPAIELTEVDGLLSVVSVPAGAAVSVDGRYRGTTPAEVELAPGAQYTLIVSKPGFESMTQAVAMESRRGRTVRLTLPPRLGVVNITSDQPDAQLFIDGKLRGVADQELSLPSRPHRIEVRKVGFATFTTEVNPQPGLPERLDIRMLTPAEAVLAAIPQTITTGDGTTLLLVAPGEFLMGAPRREQGRRPNEAQHRVELTRPFYLATTEVTNSRFLQFKPKHTSGSEKYRQLATGKHPAVMMSWEEATGYCNWLSGQDGLDPAYVFEEGDIVLASPPTTGYRLPTEAEWAWAGRFNGGAGARKFPWGDRMPLVEGAGNYADKSARSVLASVLNNYNDSFPVTAPVGTFAAGPLGFYDMGGNVSEWVTDRYGVYTDVNGTEVDPLGPDKGQYHVIRGSGWRHSSISELRFAYRDFGDRGRLDVGFRIARYADVLLEQSQ
jgi:formylglycine-generating enzyme required for sulfatase activity